MYGSRGQTASGVGVPVMYARSPTSASSAFSSELGANWVRETVNWAEDRRKRGGAPKPYAAPLTANQQVSPATTGALPSPLSSVSDASSRYSRAAAPGTLASATANGSPSSAFGRRPLRTAPSAPAASSAAAPSPQPPSTSAAAAATTGPAARLQPSPQSAPASASSVRVAGLRAQRRREDPEEQRMRAEMDGLMSQVLQLQDGGRFSEVPPLMRRIDALQRQLESCWQQQHVAATGAAAPLPPMPDIVSPVEKAALASEQSAPQPPSQLQTSQLQGSQQQEQQQQGSLQQQAAQRRQRKQGHKPATASLGQKIGGLMSGGGFQEQTQRGEEDAEASESDDEEKLDVRSSGSSGSGSGSRAGAVPPAAPASAAAPAAAASAHAADAAPSLPGGRRRRMSLSRQVSDHLLLVSGEREQEIIQTLQTKSQRAAAAAPRGGRGVFGPARPSTRAMAPAAGPRLASDEGSSSGGDGASATAAPPPLQRTGPRPVFSRWTSTRASTQASTRSLGSQRRSGARERTMLTVEGWMYKAPPQHKLLSRWRNRYFVLAGPLLSYRKGAHVSRIIPLKGAKAELVVLERQKLSSKGRYEIRLQCANAARVYRLRQRVRKTALEWFVAIQNNIKVAAEDGDATLFERRRRDKKESRRAAAAGGAGGSDWVPPERDRTGEDVAMAPGDEEAEDVNAFYRALGLAPSASAGVIKKRYRELAREYHPDKNRAGTDVSRFAEIARAFETLQDADLRRSYDLCERVKLLLRQGVLFTQHEENQRPRPVVMVADDEFKILFWQDADLGSVLHEGYRYVFMRFVQEILAGSDGFACPPGKADCCLTLRGVLLGCTLGVTEKRATSICLQMQSKQARDDMLDGLRILRCRFSELFKQRFDEMRQEGMR